MKGEVAPRTAEDRAEWHRSRLAKQTRPERSRPSRRPTEDAQGSRTRAKIGIGGGVLAVLIAGGIVYYRRSLDR